MKLFRKEPKKEPKREPKQYALQKRSGPPRDGVGGTLAGVAETGDCCDILGYGAFVNVGTLTEPRWVRRDTDDPPDGYRRLGSSRR